MAELTVKVIETSLEKNRQKDQFDTFIALVKYVSSWEMVRGVTGNEADFIRKTATVEQLFQLFEEIATKVKDNSVPLYFISKLNTIVNETNTQLMLKFIGLSDSDIGCFPNMLKYLEEQTKRCQTTEDVLRECNERQHRQIVDYLEVMARVEVIKDKLLNKQVTLIQCRTPRLLWEDLSNFQNGCVAIQDVIHSAVFWNVANDVNASLHCQSSIELIECLNHSGLGKYIETWTNLTLKKQESMDKVNKMFAGVTISSIEKELDAYERVSKTYIEGTTRRTLILLFDFNSLQNRVKTLLKIFSKFELDVDKNKNAWEALCSFEGSFENDFGNKPFEYVELIMNKTVELTGNIQDITLQILSRIADSPSLLDFLKEIKHEDARNLIDAVEDISESHVQVGTVSAFIEANAFVQKIFDSRKNNDVFFQFLQSVNECVKEHKSNVLNLPVKIQDCALNLHNLKSLYNNVANRGQHTKEIVQSILQKGTLKLSLDDLKSTIVFIVTYEENNKNILNEPTVIDMRSRALLLLNSDKESQQRNRVEFQEFVKLIDLCQNIRDTLQSLYTAGHIEYIEISETLTVTGNAVQSRFDQLNRILGDWEHDLDNIRQRWYLMNYLQGYQIQIIYKYLTTAPTNQLKQDVTNILKFIHPEMHREMLEEEWGEREIGPANFLYLLSAAIHRTYKRVSLKPIKNTSFTDEKQEQVIVHEGKIFLTVLNGNNDLVLRTILALYQGTYEELPKAYQLLICTRHTTWNELDLHLSRCQGAKEFYKITPLFCLANIELLGNDVQFKLAKKLRDFKTGQNFRLALICKGSSGNPFGDLLSSCVSSANPVSEHTIATLFQTVCPNVKAITSEVAGLGKSSKISSIASELGKSTKVLHVSGVLDNSSLIHDLNRLDIKAYNLLHIDIGEVDHPHDLDMFLFQLIVLRIVSNRQQSFWLPTQSVCIEIGNSVNNKLSGSMLITTKFFREHLSWKDFDDFVVSCEMNSPIQIVCNYLNLLESKSLDTTEILLRGKNKARPLENHKCRKLLKRFLSKQQHMSFSNVNIFLNVLADQLKKFTRSAYFKVSHVSDMVDAGTTPDIRSCLVTAMVEVAQDFATRSVSTYYQENDTGKATITNVCQTNKMIRWEDSNHLIYVFHNQDIQTLSVLYRKLSKVPKSMQQLFQNQLKRKMVDYTSLNQGELQAILQKISRSQKEELKEAKGMPYDYVLTPDNLLKMVLILLRISANVPVVVMGETGCGKTSLIRYLSTVCQIDFIVYNIHSGISKDEIVNKILHENKESLRKGECQRWLFLDEFNTSECIGLIGDIICHHVCNGVHLAPNLIIIGACNPYRPRSQESIQTNGLPGKVKTDELSKLVYRVFPLPEMVVDYVWDFGFLTDMDELKYIERMTETVFPKRQEMHLLLRDLIFASNRFVRQNKSVYSVSLRDVDRCKLMIKWFAKNWTFSSGEIDKESIHGSILLALSVCYQSRFDDKKIRANYWSVLVQVYLKYGMTKTAVHMQTFVEEEQEAFLHCMELPPGTAKNAALRENVFLITVCILNKIPIFVVGKPGCSKSLAMQVIKSSLRGKDSKNKIFQKYPQLYCVSFQGSESSTSDGILKVFDKAEQYQTKNSKDDVLAVVILDEIGLAEVSRSNPLKVLHNLLEPGGRSSPNVAVVGISNWSLDASKMNMGIQMSRPDMDEVELLETARSISKSYIEDSLGTNVMGGSVTLVDLLPDLKAITNSYCRYTKSLQFQHFHGLRDFYALVKFIAKGYVENPKCSRSELIIKGIERNFGGLRSGKLSFMTHFNVVSHAPINRNCVAENIKANIQDKQARHLMIITKGESVLGFLEKTINECGYKQKDVIFGSQFEEDLTEDYYYRILSRVILCMEQGFVLILKDLDSIYGSLYDMLNQNYTRIGKSNNCRVALGPYSNPFCSVSEDFRCIVLVDFEKVQSLDPPFLNRFEKQVISVIDTMPQSELDVMLQLRSLVEKMSEIESTQFSIQDVFPYCNDEFLASLVMISPKELDCEEKLAFCETKLLWFIKPDSLIRLHRAVDENIRKKCSDLQNKYCNLPIHKGLKHFIIYQKASSLLKMAFVYTNSNIHTGLESELEGFNVQIEKIGSFKSEKKLSSNLDMFWKNKDVDILIVQCHALNDGHHILLTKTLIERSKNNAKKAKADVCKKHVIFIIHLSSGHSPELCLEQINYLSCWELVTMERLETPPVMLEQICRCNLQETVRGMMPLRNIIVNSLPWAFSRIKYGQRGRNIRSIENVIEKIESDTTLLDELESLIIHVIEKETRGDANTKWWIDIACDFNAIASTVYFTQALHNHILKTVRNPLAKIIFQLENHGALFSFSISDALTNDRRECWKNFFHNEELFQLDDIPQPSGPECFYCSTPGLNLKLPFVYVIFGNVQTCFDSFKMAIAKVKFQSEKSSVDELDESVLNEMLHEQMEIMIRNVKMPRMYALLNEHAINDYMDDFCNLFSHALSSQLPDDSRIEYTKWAVRNFTEIPKTHSQNFENDVFFLHCCVWLHNDLLIDTLHLFKTYEIVCRMNGIDKGFDYFEKHFVSKCKSPKLAASAGESIELENEEGDHRPEKNHVDLVGGKVLSTRQEAEEKIGTSCVSTENTEREAPSEFNQTRAIDQFTSFVKFMCSELIQCEEASKMFQTPLQWQMLAKRIFLSAENISVVSKEYQSLKIINEILTTLVIPFELRDNLRSVFLALKHENNIDSDCVQNAIIGMISCKSDASFLLNACESVRQYLYSCLTLDPLTLAHKLPCSIVKTKPEFEQCIQRWYLPFKDGITIAIEENDQIFQELLLKDDHKIESESLFGIINDVVKTLSEKRKDSLFILMLIDIFFEVMSVNQHFLGSDDIRNCLLACGTILQKQNDENWDIRLIVAIAFLKKFFMFDTDIYADNDLLETWDAVLYGLKQTVFYEPMIMMSVRMFGGQTVISEVKQNCSQRAERVRSLKEITWTKGYELTCLENNPFFILLKTQLIRSLPEAAVGNVKDKQHFNEIIKAYINNVKTSLGNKSVPIYVTALAITNFYLCRNCTSDANMDMYASELIAITSCFTQQQQEFIKCIVGKKDFALPSYVINTTTDVEVYMMNFVLVTLHACSLCEMDTSRLTASFLDASVLQTVYSDGINLNHSVKKNIDIWECDCGQTVYIDKEKSQTKMCFVCGFDFDNDTRLKQVDTIASQYAKKVEGVWSQNVLELARQRGITPLTCAIIQFFTFGSVRGSFSCGFQNEEQLKRVLDCEDPITLLDKKVTSTWRKLKRFTNFNDVFLGIYLLTIFKEAIESKFNCQNPDAQLEIIVKKIEGKKHKTVHKVIRDCDKVYGFSQSSVELKVKESHKLDGNQIERLFRLTSVAEKDEFISKLYHTSSKRFSFLLLVVENEKLLYLPQYIFVIIQWHSTTMMLINFKHNRQSCMRLTAGKFLDNIKDKSLQAFSKTRFESFAIAMTTVNETLKNFGMDVETITNDTVLHDCLLIDTNSYVYKILHKLVNIQNSFIVESMRMSMFCRNLQFLCSTEGVSNVPRVSVVDVKSVVNTNERNDFDDVDLTGDLVNLSESWFDIVVEESTSNLEYGCGFDIQYNFDRIERRLAEPLLFRKSIIELDFNRLPHIVFVDELYATFFSLVNDVCDACPQEQITKEVETAIRENISNNKSLATELLNELDVLMTAMKRTRIDPSTLLYTYIEQRRHTTGKYFPLEHLRSVKHTLKVRHIVSFHELLEEMVSDILLLEINSPKHQDGIDAKLDKRIIHSCIPNAKFGEVCLKALKRFHFRCIQMGNMDVNQSIASHLAHESFWPAKVCSNGTLNIDGKKIEVSELFPEEVHVADIGSLVAIITEVSSVCNLLFPLVLILPN